MVEPTKPPSLAALGWSPMGWWFFHVVMRAVRQSPMYVDRLDEVRYFDFLDRYAEVFGIRCHTYDFEGNHLHGLFSATREKLGAFFHRVHTNYSRYFNGRHGVKGHLFESDFRAFPIQSTQHLLQVSLYAHLNPVKDLGVAHPVNYRACSFPAFRDPSKAPPWLDFGPILGQISCSEEEARAIYERELKRRVQAIHRLRERRPGPPPVVQGRGRFYQWSDAQLQWIVPTLLEPGLVRVLSDRTGLPAELFTLYVAVKMRLAPLTRLCVLLGLSRTKARRGIEEIEEDEYLRRTLTASDTFMPRGSSGFAA